MKSYYCHGESIQEQELESQAPSRKCAIFLQLPLDSMHRLSLTTLGRERLSHRSLLSAGLRFVTGT